ncbi:putative pregnancy-specific beta-1-glycoprotein 7 [Dissostichus eleginoides]|uniref:Pregnancy-specific beta-1-glycoprotein 7 n=1 Tax=Dissostichus eleginoides TaxID=100907 RepID=A0AAD9F521_DISEL|nr:putative pregnancy-specific beta-1-glycoprotein 7 [Dissostichus eleginoides]
MSEFRRIIMSSFLMLLLHFPAADVKDHFRIVGVGDEVILPFGNVIDDQDECESATWFFFYSPNPVVLFESGQIHKDAKAKSDRLRVTENCSLVIKKVTDEDAGRYLCRQIRPGQQDGPDSQVYLSVVNMTEHQKKENVMLNCSVSTNGRPQSSGWWWWIIVVIVGVAALTIITVAVIRRKRTQGTRTETDDDMADPEDGVSYASISFTRKSSSKARAHLHDDDEDDAVTYSTVRAPSSSSAASADPSLLYATVNKQRK